MRTTPGKGRRVLAATAGLSLAVTGMVGIAQSSAAPSTGTLAGGTVTEDGPEDGPEDKVRAEVRSTLATEGRADVWITLADQADLSAAQGMAWDERGDYVYDTLREHATRTQAPLRADLDADGVAYETFWINNAIFVPDASAALVDSLAARSGVGAVKPDYAPELAEPVAVSQTDAVGPRAPEWGLADIGAPEIWSEYDQRGEGIVVGTFDSGAEGTHPALEAAYRGTETGSDDYNWFDSRPGGSPTPVDDDGHGTHVTGTMVGEDGENQIGVAPDAQWIAAAGCCVNGTDYVATFEWFLAPTPVGGGEGDPDQRPHIINNSWGPPGQEEDPYWEEAIGAWTAAGIFPTWAVGNSGPGCDTVLSPSWNDVTAYNVGDYQSNHEISPSSSRGLTQSGELGVDIGAPGTDVRSSVPGGGYANYSGTSMASPHVAGAVALLWAEFPEYQGDFAATSEILDVAAIDTEDPTCGGDLANNPTFGEGRLNVPAMFEAAGGDDPEPPETEVIRWQSDDPEENNRYTTAAAIAGAFPEGSDVVYVASGETYIDALGASPAAAQGLPAAGDVTRLASGAPLLLTKSDAVPSATAEALELLGATDVVVIGGEEVVSEEVFTALGGTVRLAGEDEDGNRYGTAAAIAALFEPGVPVVYVANGAEDDKAADALVGAARAGAEGGPVLLTKGDGVPAITAEALAALEPESVVVLGGVDAVDNDTLAALGAAAGVEATRLSGPDRWGTAVAVSEGYEAGGAQVLIANGNNWPDTLAGAAYAGSVGVPVQIVRTDHVPTVVFDELGRLATEQIVILGGTAAVDEDVEARLGEVGAE